MIYEAITILIYAVLIASFLQPNAHRLFAGIIFTGITLLHEVLLASQSGFLYYGSAALFDLTIIMLISGINPVPKMVLTLQKICVVSIVVNLAGWLLWCSYYPPLAYDLAFAAIYVWILVALIKRGRGDGMGGFTMDRWASCVRFNRSPWALYFYKNSGQV